MEATELEVLAARRVISFLEDRRVLYAPDELEVPSHCVHSVMDIRGFLSSELGKLDAVSEFGASLRAMRAGCRKFLERVGVDGREATLYANHHGHWASWTFYSALGEMRGIFGSISKITSRPSCRLKTRRVPMNIAAHLTAFSVITRRRSARLCLADRGGPYAYAARAWAVNVAEPA